MPRGKPRDMFPDLYEGKESSDNGEAESPSSSEKHSATKAAVHHPLRLAVELPPDGLELKLMDSKHRITGTLHIDEHGVKYSKVNGRSQPERGLSFNTLARLMDTGL